jgi:hypothetical protein
MADAPTIEDLGKLVKQQHPGFYDAYPDADVGRRRKRQSPQEFAQYQDLPEAAAPLAPTAPLAQRFSQNIPPPAPAVKPTKQPKPRNLYEWSQQTGILKESPLPSYSERAARAAEERKTEAEEKLQEKLREGRLTREEQIRELNKIPDSELSPKDKARIHAEIVAGRALPPESKRVMDKGVGRPGTDPATGDRYKGLWDHTVEADGTETWAPHDAPATRALPRQGDYISGEQLGKMIDQGQQVYGADGETQLTKEQVAALGPDFRVWNAGGKFVAIPAEVKDVVTTAGGQVYASSPFERQRLPQGAGVNLGPSRVPMTRTSQQLAFNPATNEMTVNTLQGTSTPVTPGIVGRPAETAPARTTVTPPQAAPTQTTPPTRITTSAPTSGRMPPAPATGGAVIRGVPLTAARAAAQFGIPITEASVSILGDPRRPDVKPLAAFAHLANDRASALRVGTAINLTRNGFGDSIGEASIGAGAGGFHISAGGFGAWLQNALGVPGKVAQQQAELIRKATEALNPEEREAYNSVMAVMSTMAGLRSLTKSPATMGSLMLIENELPKLFNVASEEQFNDQISRVAGTLFNAVTTPGMFPAVNGQPSGIAPDVVQRIKDIATKKGSAATQQQAPKYKKGDRAKSPGKPDLEFDGTKWVPVAPGK